LATPDRAIEALDDSADTELEVALAAVQCADNQIEDDGVDPLLAFILKRHALLLLLNTPQQLQ
jgi:hypothetical protein